MKSSDHDTKSMRLIIHSDDAGDEASLEFMPNEIFAMKCAEKGTLKLVISPLLPNIGLNGCVSRRSS